jgi:hypothetical protein
MKKFYILLIALFVVNGAIGQLKKPCISCLPQGIIFFNQAQIDNFQLFYPGCTEIEGGVYISEQSSNNILNLNGLSVLNSIGGYIYIFNNAGLTNLMGLNNLISVGGFLGIQANSSMTSLTGLESLTSIGSYLIIQGNGSLASLNGLENLVSIGDYLSIEGADSLTNLTGLEQLTSIGGFLFLDGNHALTNLTGLDSLNSINGFLRIDYNSSLTSLSGLDNIEAGSIDSLYIQHNTSLSTCQVQSICDYLSSPNGTIEIHNNATGCNSRQEVEDACAAIGVESLIPELLPIIYPNPASTAITFKTSSEGHLSILNFNGQQLLRQEITEPNTTIDVSTLPNGVYVVKVVGENRAQVGKVIKQ